MIERPFAQPRMNINRQHSFARAPQANIPRSVFNRSHGYKTTFDAGLIIPILADEALPGDTFNLKATTFARLATPITPVMDNLYCDLFFFAVPIRLIWTNWYKFNGAQDNPGDSTAYVTPKLASGSTATSGSLSDYLGLPIDKNLNTAFGAVTSLWHRAYNLIWNEWFRDQNLQSSITVDKGDGPDTLSNYVLKRRGKRHDYFTSCLPWPQKGTAVSLSLGTTAPVLGLGIRNQTTAASAGTGIYRQTGGITPATTGWDVEGVVTTPGAAETNIWIEQDPSFTGFPYLRADLTNATMATINTIREAFQMQKLFERDARGGTRYTEIVKAHFGVTSPDARLQRPEFLGGGSTMINMSPIPQTSVTSSTPQGNLAAMGTFSHSGVGFVKSFDEHCVILGLASVRADLNYMQGCERQFLRSSRYDFYWPALAHLGEQAVLNREIYWQGTTADDDVFGYQERYAEYRYKPSLITGKLRSQLATPLDMWHLAQEFSTLPTLGATFIEENPPIARVIAVPSEPHFIMDVAYDYKCARPMPVFSVPGLMDAL